MQAKTLLFQSPNIIKSGESPKEEKMIYLLGTYEHALVAFIGVLFAFAVTCIAIAKLNRYLPKDMGRQYAHDGALSAGKPRGAGIIFVLTLLFPHCCLAK